MALAAFAALAQIGVTAYADSEEAFAQKQAQGIAENQELGMQQNEQAQTFQNAQSSADDEQWMQLKNLSTQLYGDKTQAPQALAQPGPPK